MLRLFVVRALMVHARVAGLALLLALVASPGQALTIKQLVVFGDSNVDIGRAFTEIGGGAVDDGMLPPPNTVGGRSSDGPILPEFVAERLGIPQLNFAWGGATSGDINILGFFGFPDTLLTGTLQQITEFENGFADQVDNDTALYLVFAGSNNLVGVDKNDQAAVDDAVAGTVNPTDGTLRTAIERLDAAGAQNIVVATRTPRPVLSEADRPEDETSEAARDDASGRQLSAAIRALVSELDAELGSNILLFDAYALIREIIANSGSNGFTAYSDAEDQFCINNADCSTLINFDAAHKTSAVHSVLADRFIEDFELEGHNVVPLPAPAWLLVAGLALLFSRRRPGSAGA